MLSGVRTGREIIDLKRDAFCLRKILTMNTLRKSQEGGFRSECGSGRRKNACCQSLCWRSPFMCWFVFIASSSWLNHCPRQVFCFFTQHNMEQRNCSDFVGKDYPQISVEWGGQKFEQSFSINEDKILDHWQLNIQCVASYPIEWIYDEMSVSVDTSQASSSSAKALTAHLHISRTFSDFSNHNTYRFKITTKVRYKKDSGLKQIHSTCRSVVKPFCLRRSISGLDNEGAGVTMRIFIDRPIMQIEGVDLSNLTNPPLSDLRKQTGVQNDHNQKNTSSSPFSNVDCDYKLYYDEHTSGSRLPFACEQNGTLTEITFIHQCSNAMTCLNLYRNLRLPAGCALPLPKNLTCVGCENRQLRLSQGVIGCDSTKEKEDANKAKRLFFFTSIPQGLSSTKLYFKMEDAPPSEMMRLSEILRQVYLGEQLTVTCNVSNFYFAGGTRLALKYANSETLIFLKTTIPKYFEAADHTGGSMVEATIPITTVSLERVYCFAPVWNSFAWVNQSRVINVKEVISADIIIAVSVTIFLTALLVATMFGLLWIKIGKKHGRLNLLTPSEIEEFRRGSISEENKSIKLLGNHVDMIYGTGATYDPIYEIKRDRLLLDETGVLGHGHFGLVFRGIVMDSKEEVRTDVAVKTLKTKVDVGSLKALLTELKILASIGKHSNVVNLVGACTKKMNKGEVFVAVEYCANGNLQNFLRRHRQAFRNQLENDILVIETPIRKLSTSSESIMTIDLIRWAWETAKGMEFLGSKKVIHGDLATRNILITADFVAKVCDFGLSRQLVDYYYVQKETGPLPWKWMALESLRDMKFSVQSDIWSFGITLWELFTLAEIPYSGCSWSAEFVETLAAGHRLGKPKFATSEMYDLIRECWKTDPRSRPSFFAIRMFFEDILTQCTSQDYIQLNGSCGTLTTDDEYQNQPLLQSPRIIIEEDEGEDDVFE